MRTRGISKIYLIAGIFISLVVLFAVIRVVAWNVGPGVNPGKTYDPASAGQAADPYPRPDHSGSPDKSSDSNGTRQMGRQE